jgi:hypothetical protein
VVGVVSSLLKLLMCRPANRHYIEEDEDSFTVREVFVPENDKDDDDGKTRFAPTTGVDSTRTRNYSSRDSAEVNPTSLLISNSKTKQCGGQPSSQILHPHDKKKHNTFKTQLYGRRILKREEDEGNGNNNNDNYRSTISSSSSRSSPPSSSSPEVNCAPTTQVKCGNQLQQLLISTAGEEKKGPLHFSS